MVSVFGLWLTPSHAAGRQNCQDLLDNIAYLCRVKSDFGTPFEDCFQFTSPGNQSLDFDLSIAGLGEILSCDCKAGGSFARPQFSESRDFHCVTPVFTSLSIAFEGQVSGHGNKIKQGHAVNEFGDAFVYECTPDPRCSISGRSKVKRSENPYMENKR
jgi:hypothetical protein